MAFHSALDGLAAFFELSAYMTRKTASTNNEMLRLRKTMLPFVTSLRKIKVKTAIYFLYLPREEEKRKTSSTFLFVKPKVFHSHLKSSQQGKNCDTHVGLEYKIQP